MSRFDFLKDKFQSLYEKCTQAEQATDNSDKTGIIRRTLEYLVCELGEDGNDLFNNIGSLSDRDILDENVSQLFHRTRMIANRGVHYNTAGSLTDSDVQIAMDNLAEITIWYAVQYKKQSLYLNDFAPEDVSIAKRYLNIHADTHSEAMRQMIQATVNVDPLAVAGRFDDDDSPTDPLEKDVFETDAEYKARIDRMAAINIGYAILDTRNSDGYTNVRFLQHHLEKNRRVRFTQSPVYFFIDYTEQDEVIDGELVAKLRVYDGVVYCDYSHVFLRSDEVDIPVQVICWDKLSYESEDDYRNRIEALPILPLAQCKPIRNQYNLEQQILPFAVRKYAYVHISMEDTYGIPCNRDLAKQVTAQKEIFTMFGKVQPAGFIIWNRMTGVLYGTANALEAKQKEEQQTNYADVKKALEQLKYKREERERQLREQRAREEQERKLHEQRVGGGVVEDAKKQCELGEYYWSLGNYVEAIKWYKKAAFQGSNEAKRALGVLEHAQREKGQRVTSLWVQRAGEQFGEDVKKQCELGEYYWSLGNYVEAIKWYKKAAIQGSDEAKRALRIIEHAQKEKEWF